MEGTTTELISSTVSPQFFYCCCSISRLLRANLLTGERSERKVPRYEFHESCRWSELPGGSLLITGGAYDGGREVLKIDTLREYAPSAQPPMHTGRSNHAALYYSQYVYVLGGWSDRLLSACERYSCAESRWEVLPAMHVAGSRMSAVELHNSLYALGGYNGDCTNFVQKLSLDSLTWEFMQLKLPQAACFFACFKKDTEVYLVIRKTLYSFTPLQVKPIKTLDKEIYMCYSSYYSRGTLYYEWGDSIFSIKL
jgi:hypothetical protein